jgi:DNA-binding GntR family transcriptional regulator
MTKTELAYNSLKDFIFQKKILPGEKIFLEKLSKKLNISPTPLREALNRLAQEGYVSYNSNRGFILQSISTAEVEMLYELCEALETYAIERTVQKIGKSDLAYLKENLLIYRKIIANEYKKERFLINNEFHMKIARLSGNEFIIKNLALAFERLVLKWIIENIQFGRGPTVYNEHMEIYDALERRDVKGAVDNIRIHIINTKKSVLQYLNGRDDFFKEPRLIRSM